MRSLHDVTYKIQGDGRIVFGAEVFNDTAQLAHTLERREKLAGRTLTQAEHIRGLVEDTRGASDKIRAGHGELLTWKSEAPDPNIYRSQAVQELIDQKQHNYGAPVDRAKLYGDAADALDARLAAERAAEEKRNQPDRVKLRAAAVEAVEFARFSRDSNVDILYAALRLAEAVERDDDLADAKKSYSKIIDDLRANAATRRAEIESQIELVRQRADFDPEPQQP